ncbi:MAG: hypothetical protein ACPGNT_10605, partial [Rhodospirillales bacterium]
MISLSQSLNKPGRWDVGGLPEGADALALAEDAGRDVIIIARDERRLHQLAEGLAFLAPDKAVVTFPAWDCQPYDRASPNTDVAGRRVLALTRLLEKGRGPLVCVTTVAAFTQ